MMKMMRVAALIAIAVPVVAFAQTTPRTTPLNRTVIVVPNATGSVPPECEQGLAPQLQPRVTPEERIAVAPVPVPAPPPSADLRGTLRAAVEAAQTNNRDAFRDRLARSKEILGSYPPGGERSAAADVVAVLDDINTLWSYEFSSPTGAFFDGSSDMYRMLGKYSGYEAAVRRQVIVDQNGARFYPSRESRDFLAGEAAVRVARLTGEAPPPPRLLREKVTTAPATTQKVTTPKPKVVETTKAATTKAPRKHVVRRAEHHARTAKPAKKTTAHKKFEKAAVPLAKPKPAAPQVAAAAPKPVTPPATTSSVPAQTAATTSAVPVTTSSAAPATMTETAPATTTTAVAAPETTTQPAQQAAPTSHRNLILPIVLIIAGVGLLVLFSRSSA